MNKTLALIFAMAALALAAQPAMAEDNHEMGEKLFKKKCTMCHSLERKKAGPAVVDMSTDAALLRQVISDGRKGTMMSGFSGKFSDTEIDALVAYLRSKQK